MGTIVLILALVIEVALAAYCIVSKSNQKTIRSFVRIGVFAAFAIFTLMPVIEWSFRWKPLGAMLLIWAIIGSVSLMRRKQDKKEYKARRIVFKAIAMMLFVVIAVTPALVLPQHESLKTTGEYEVSTVVYTYTDDSRTETFTDTGENRKVTVQFWYPLNADATYPLTVFSHGAFGFKMSNESTYMELASNGYVVCSIDHPYHSMGTADVDGNFTMVDMNFYQEVNDLNSGIDEKTKYEYQEKWMEIRTADMNFVIDTIIENADKQDSDEVYQILDTDKIGVFGHSLGGAAAAAVGREREDIDAVVNIDAPLLGELIGFEEGEYVINDEPYNHPLLNIYSDDVWGQLGVTPQYNPNHLLLSNTPDDVYNVNFEGAKHMSLTDLPLFSPMLATMLQGGKADIDEIYCIETMNKIILEFFDHYIKAKGVRGRFS